MDVDTNVAPPLSRTSPINVQYPPPLTPAQRLIERYERLSTPPPHTPPPQPLSQEKSTLKRQYVYDYRDDPFTRAAGSLATPDSLRDRGLKGRGRKHEIVVKKDKSPIRQSLRNLFSVIKKGAGGLAKRRSEDRLGLAAAAEVPGAAVPPRLSSSSSSAAVNEGSRYFGSVAMKTSPAATSARLRRKRMTGPLFYFIPGGPTLLSSPGLPVWTSCSVTLDVDAHKLLVSSFTGSEMELCIHEILLSRCSDIRSLAVAQLGKEESKALDEIVGPEKETLRVFEVLFEGREREKFAARSVKERAGWISAIW
jgi:hypothetical protein